MKVYKACHALEVVVNAFKITKIVELPGGFATLDPLSGLSPTTTRCPRCPWTPSKSFNIPAAPLTRNPGTAPDCCL
ncbi:hypothetical protein DPMN_065886 [Dreissena polymorpha]|uniref:Uncharacterized protein n=1 Tax=Dreissena polymorpha TaxID=45954 RepID=A0A9D3YXZ4_DREPO|nr:hypothetical protein DPMN_065886 [Dreissena polymorpha]